jgi:MFS-type transporter involved in bile tolerance (Atg22 family)
MQPTRRPPDRSQADMTTALAGLLGQVGCLTVFVILAALAAGLWLDQRLGTRPTFTLGLVLGSIPLSIYLMIRVLQSGMTRVQPSVQPKGQEDDVGPKT